jgi:hypothetical protein
MLVFKRWQMVFFYLTRHRQINRFLSLSSRQLSEWRTPTHAWSMKDAYDMSVVVMIVT